MSERERWTDDRLDDLNREVERMIPKVEEISVIKEIAKRGADDASMCRQRVHLLANDQAASLLALRNELAARDAAVAKERKSDRWKLASLLVAVLALLLPAIVLLAGHA